MGSYLQRMHPQVIFFDLGGVVSRFHPQRRLSALGEACGVSVELVERTLYASGRIAQWDAGHGSATDIHRTLQEELGYTGGITTLKEIWCRAFEPDQEVLDLVDGLRSRRTALLTDNDHLLLDALPDELPQVAARFDDLLFSCRLGAVKPDPTVFVRALDIAGVTPGEAVFIDDKAENVAAARELGINGIRFSGAVALGVELDSLLAH